MKKVIIATTNKDKYKIVSKIFKATIFPESDYQIDNLEAVSVTIEDRKEEGDNISRARTKALDAYNALKEYDYDYVVGLDDAIRIKGVLEPNIKSYVNKILFENYLNDDEEYSFNRAYCLIDKDNNMYEVTAEIPYIYRSNPNIHVEEFSYPLSQVAYPIGSSKNVNDLSDDEELEYYLKYVKSELDKLNLR